MQLQKPATFEATRLQTKTPNCATFYIVVFAGEVVQTKSLFTAFTKAISGAKWLSDTNLPIQWLSVLAGPGSPSAFETLEGMPFGRVFYDEDHSAHKRYDIDLKKGAVFVLRPDGCVGTVVEMDGIAAGKLEKYFSRFLVGLERPHKATLRLQTDFLQVYGKSNYKGSCHSPFILGFARALCSLFTNCPYPFSPKSPPLSRSHTTLPLNKVYLGHCFNTRPSNGV